MSSAVWDTVHAAVLTSATIPVGLPQQLGLPTAKVVELDVGSPFPYRELGLLYCAKHLPDPRKPEAEAAVHDELERLIVAAGGRTLSLFTSRRALTSAVNELRARIGTPVLAQDDLPKQALIDAFRSDPKTSLFATMGYWQGVDVPGESLVLVTIDRLPFARPDDPLLAARRERAGDSAFATIDLPRAGMLLAQGAGRLIRSATDRGVVAVLDSRLATAGYRKALLSGVPPLKRTVDTDEVVAFLESLNV
jgi:ATP-dependent DNA helicase DinG